MICAPSASGATSDASTLYNGAKPVKSGHHRATYSLRNLMGLDPGVAGRNEVDLFSGF
jgi:hypothetical protein